LRLVSRGRTERLTDAETVAIGRALVDSSANAHISYPDDSGTAVVVVHEFRSDLTDVARIRISECLGEFDESLIE
jgi:hypothetical protein